MVQLEGLGKLEKLNDMTLDLPASLTWPQVPASCSRISSAVPLSVSESADTVQALHSTNFKNCYFMAKLLLLSFGCIFRLSVSRNVTYASIKKARI
jgi:hypothetical protein